MANNPSEEMMEVDGAIGGEHVNSFEEKKEMLVEREGAGVEGVEDMVVEKCPACGFAWIDQLSGSRSRWICKPTSTPPFLEQRQITLNGIR